MFWEFFGYYILFRSIEFIFGAIGTKIFNRLLSTSEISYTRMTKDELVTEGIIDKKSKKQNDLITISPSTAIKLPTDFATWHPIDKARLISLYAVDVMFRGITPLLKVLIADEEKKRL